MQILHIVFLGQYVLTEHYRKQYSVEYRTEALALAARLGVSAAARQLGVHASQIYGWRAKAKRELGQGETERQLAAENVRLKRQVADQAEELAILKKRRRTSQKA